MKSPGNAFDDARFVISRSGAVVGSETWHVERLPDGSVANTFASKLQLRETPVKMAGTLRFDAALSITGASIEALEADQPSKVTLVTEANHLALTVTRPGHPDEKTTESQRSSLFLARPSMAGLMPLCRRSPAANDTLYLFPGAAVRVLSSSSPSPGVRELVLDVASSSRVEVACNGDDVAVVRIPMQSIAFVREGAEPLAASMVARSERGKPKVPNTLVEEDRTVDVPSKGSDGKATLSCSFLRPKDLPTSKMPAVVFATGSGPEDRDEDTVGPGGLKLAIFKTMAIRLGEAGIASLRCDDRGTGKSTGDFPNATLETFVRDARATVDALRKEPSIDPQRIGFVGHSEGGVIGPRVAIEDRALRDLFLMAAPGESLADIGVKQLKRVLRMSGASEEETTKQVNASQNVINAIASGKPLPDTLEATEKTSIEKQRAWLKSEFANDPIKVIAKVRCPVFIAQGNRDEQVPPEDADALLAALRKSGHSSAQAKRYPDLNHLFAPTITGSTTDYSDPAAKLSDEFLGDAVGFLSGALSPDPTPDD